jgi:hypothetical protein
VVSGSLSGALVSACVQPLDVVRTRMQADMAHGIVRSTMHTMQTILSEVRRSWPASRCCVPCSRPLHCRAPADGLPLPLALPRAACARCGGARSPP